MTPMTPVIWTAFSLLVLIAFAVIPGSAYADDVRSQKVVPCIVKPHQCGAVSPCFDCTVPSCLEFKHQKLPQGYAPCQPTILPCRESKVIQPSEEYKPCPSPCLEFKIKPCTDFNIKPVAGVDFLSKHYGTGESTLSGNILVAQNNAQGTGKQTPAQPHDPNPQKDPDVQRGYDDHQRTHGREPKGNESSYDVHTSSGTANSGSNGGGDDTPPHSGNSVPRYAPDERRPVVVRPAPGPIPH